MWPEVASGLSFPAIKLSLLDDDVGASQDNLQVLGELQSEPLKQDLFVGLLTLQFTQCPTPKPKSTQDMSHNQNLVQK